MKRLRAVLCFIFVLALTAQLLAVGVFAGESQTDTYAPTNYQQADSRWGNKQDIASSGCGLISLVNAVHYLNGTFINPVELAIYAHDIDAYNGSVGGGTARWVLYCNIKNFEEKYGFRVTNSGASADVKDTRFIKHLKNGGTAVAHVYGHFIAVCGYNEADKTYLIYDCAANYDRRNTTTNGDWMTVGELTGKLEYLKIDWWCLLESTCTSKNTTSLDSRVYENCEAKGYIRVKKGEYSNINLSGTAYSSRGIKSLYYTVNYNLDTTYGLMSADEISDGKGIVEYNKNIDLSNVKGITKGEQIVRVSAETLDGGVCDVAEFTISVHDGNTYTDENGNFLLDMSGFYGQDGVVLKLASLNWSHAAYKMGQGSVLNLGYIDLSQYRQAIIRYSVKNVYDADKYGVETLIGLKSGRLSFGDGQSENNTDLSIAYANMEDGDGEGYKSVKEAVLDLSGIDYAGYVFLSSSTYMISPVREILFIANEEETTIFEETTAFEETTEELTTEAETEAPTTAQPIETTAETADETSFEVETSAESEVQTTVAQSSGGCTSAISAIFILLMPCSAFALAKRRKENE